MNKTSKRLLFGLLILEFMVQGVSSQIFTEGQPIFNPNNQSVFVPKVEINVSFEQNSKVASQFKDNQFAQQIDVNINTNEYGVWIDYPELNKRIWILEIEVENASSLNLLLSPFKLKEGAKLFFYDKDQTQIKGAITQRNNKPFGVLPISIIESSNIYCELQLPLYQKDFGELTISEIGAGYPKGVTKFKSPNDDYFGSSSSCHVNVNCVSFKNLNLQKNAVCRIIYHNSKRCTGTLINNIENDETPYVITAAHCFRDENSANGAVFYFNFESPDCSNTDVEPLTISGASLVAAGYHNPQPNTWDTLDFTLLRLSEKPPKNYEVFYSGWDATNNYIDSTYSIHHPQGDIKKISIDQDSPETGDFSYFDDYTHWSVKDYELGTTEVGSSGAGLFDQNSKLVGTLTGGGDPCSPIMNDKYQKFYHAFNDYKDSTYQLKHWLDPKNTGTLVCFGYDPSFSYRKTAGLIYNFKSDSIPYIVEQASGQGYLAGHNYQGNYLFAEHYKINGSKYLVGANLNFAQISSDSVGQYVILKVWQGGNKPGNIIYEKKVLVSDFEDAFNVNSDALQAIEFDSTILVDYDFYFGYEIDNTGDTFALKTYSAEESDNSAFTFYNGVWQPLLLDGNTTFCHLASEIFSFDVKVINGKVPDTAIWPEIHVYPNPASEKVQVYFNQELSGTVICTLFNISGLPVLQEKWVDPGLNMPFYLDVSSGVYILKVVANNNTVGTAKVLVF